MQRSCPRSWRHGCAHSSNHRRCTLVRVLGISMHAPLIELLRQPHMSVSALKTYIQCPRKYRLQYVDRCPPDFRPAALALGSAWHDTIDRWLITDARLESLRADLRDGLERRLRSDDVLFDDDDENEGVLIDTSIKMLDAFIAKVPKPERTIDVEVPFSIELAHPVTGEVLPLPIIGAIDAIVIENGDETIWELKTGKRRWSADQLESDPQPTTYGIAARELGFTEAKSKILVTLKWAKPDVQV